MKQKLLVTLLVMAFLLSACDVFNPAEPTAQPLPTIMARNEIVAEGHIVPEKYARLGFTSGGIVSEVLAEDGQEVTAGDVLARLDGRLNAEAALSTVKLEQTAAQAALNDLERYAEALTAQAQLSLAEAQKAYVQALDGLDDVDTGDFQETVDNQKIEMVDAETELEDAKDEFDKYKDLDPDNQTRKNAQTALDDAREAYNRASRDYDLLTNTRDMAAALLAVAEARLKDAEQDYADRASGPDPDDLVLAQDRLAAADARVLVAQKTLDDLELKAPFSGRVVQVNITAGEVIAPLQPLLVLMAETAWYVETSDLTEMDVVYLENGQSVQVVPDALPEIEVEGKIETISDVFSEQSGDITYTVRIRLDEKPAGLRWGMTVTVHIPKK